MKHRLTLTQIRDSLPEEKHIEDKATYSSYYIMRVSAVYPAWFALRLGISANQITVMAFLAGLAGCFIFATGNYTLAIIAIIIFFIRDLLDFVDGTVARATKTTTKQGMYLDRVCDDIMGMLIPIAIGIGISMISLGLTLALLHAGNALLISEGDYAFPNSGNIYRTKAKGLWRLVYIVGVNIQSLSIPMLLVAVLTYSLPIYLYFYISWAGCELIAIVGKRLWSSREQEKKQ